MRDKLVPEAYSEIEEVVNFSKRVALNFDCLRAIAFELNLGQNFADAISDLNIINIERERYRVTARFADGSTLTNKNYYMDSFNEEEKTVYLYNRQGNYAGEITFQADAIKFNSLTGELYVDGSDVSVDYDGDEDDEKSRKALIAKEIQQVTIQRVQASNLHYAV